MNEPNFHNEAPASRLGPGDRLQAARIALGLTLDDVASKMHLSTAILISLEENHFEDITAPIFVKGYLRSYARIVNLDENEIINEYSNYATDGDPPITSTSNMSREVNISDTRFKGGTWLVILVMLGLLVTWWWNRQEQAQETLSLETGKEIREQEQARVPETTLRDVVSQGELAESAGGEGVDSRAVAVVNQQMASESAQAVIDDQQDSDGPGADEVLAESIAGLSENPETQPEPAPADTPGAPSEAAQALASEAQVEPSPEPAGEPVAQSEPGFEGLEIEVVADTWADVRDADGNKLVYDLLRAGSNLRIDGKAPFSAFLGNGYGVTLRYQGELIELDGKIRADNTARLRIGQ